MKKKPTPKNLQVALKKLDNRAHIRRIAACLIQSEEFREEVKETIRQSKKDMEILWEHRDRLDYPTKERVSDLAVWIAKYEMIVRSVEEVMRERVQ